MTEKGIIGNKSNLELIKAFASGKSFGNAFLFLGKSGSGRHTLAAHLMASMLCEDNTGCGNCRACRLISKNIHPDTVTLVPGEGRKNVSVDDVRAFIKEAYISPIEGRYKFLIINEADKLNQQSQNALLLVLEEPPEKTVFVLFAENKNQILKTVLSRSFVINSDVIPKKEIESYLISRGSNPVRAERAARLSEGGIGKALSLLETENDETVVSELLRSFVSKSPFAAYEKFFSQKLDKREKIAKASKELVGAARDLLAYKTTGDIKSAEFFSDEELIKKASAVLSVEGLVKLIQIADETAYACEQNCNAGVLAANLFIKGWECFNG